MQPVTNGDGQKGFFDESTGFIPLDAMQKVTNATGERGYYHEGTGFVPAPAEIAKTETPKPEKKVEQPKAIDRPEFLRYSNTPKLGRAALEMGGATAGALLTAPGGATSIAGGGVGYATGKLLADKLDEMLGIKKQPDTLERIATTGKDVALGTLMQGAGEGVVNAAKLALQWAKGLGETGIAVSPEDVLMRAKDILIKNTSKNPIYEANATAAGQVAKEIPGYKPSLAEGTNDPNLIKLQRSLARTGGAADTELQHRATNRKALSDFLDTQFAGGKSIDDVLAELKAQETTATGKVTAASQNVNTLTSKLNPVNKQQAGENIAQTLTQARTPVKEAASAKYAALPNEPLQIENTTKALKSVEGEFAPGEESVFPSGMVAKVQKVLTPKEGGNPVGFQDLHSLRKDIGRQIHEATAGANPNLALARRLQMLKQGIDADIEKGMVSDAYTEARTAYADYANRFRAGSVGKILQKGNQPSGLALPFSNIPSKVFTPDGADELIRAVGKDKAAALIEGYASDDLLSHAMNVNTKELNGTSLRSWLNKNKVVLDKFGLSKDFSSIEAAQSTLETAKGMQDKFQKSVASRMLNADPAAAIDKAIQGKNTGESMVSLVASLRGNKDAVQGLKNAFKDFMVAKAENTAKTITGENIISNAKMQTDIKKYEPAMRVLYGASSPEYKALQNVQKAVEISSRSASSPLGGGSDTAELGSTALDTMARVVGMPGIKAGGTVSLTIRLAQKGLDVINKLSNEEVQQVLTRAMYDPALAHDLLMAKRGLSPEIVSKNINAKLVAMGLIGTGRTLDQRR